MQTQPQGLNIPNYKVIDTLHTGSKTIVYRAIRRSDSQSIILKILQNEYPSFNELLQFRHQYTITKNLKIPGIVSPYSLEPYNNGYILTMVDCGGISLQEYAQTHSLTVEEILNIALQLSEILHHLHHARVIHKDIKPANILIHPQSKQIWLIDFSIASLLPKETQKIQNPNVLEGTLAYIAPEQTGRMNRGIDYRTDFYSLGITLYELLTRQLPFQADDPMELVHCHLAKPAPLIHHLQNNIPVMISKIIAKLMAKNAENRYQSALGLKYDLEQCLIQFKSSGDIKEFQLGQRDLSDQFLIPEKIYGRAIEVQELLNAFERVAKGTSEMMLVAGFSGIGKTAVINEVHKPITRQKGYFIKGKFDQFNRNIPLSAFVQAFRDLIGQLLCESDEQLAQWQGKILAALGDQGQVLIEVIPELESIIGQQPSVAELSGTAAQNRFNRLFQKFVEVFTTKDHPLVIFLDDLQWADLASLELIKLLMNESCYLLMLGAYRDNEVSATHPFILTVEELTKAETTVNTITLKPLTFEDTNHLITDTLHCTTELAQPLTELINRKTKGNPFFTTQFLKALYEDGQISFNTDHRYWECDITQVNAQSLTDDVVEFMALQLQKLPAETQEVLKLAACVGNQFDLKTLAIVNQQFSSEIATALWKALQCGLILPTTQVYKFFQGAEQSHSEDTVNPKYRFLHDRVQQAAYSLIPENQKQVTHLQIGQLLLKNSSDSERQEKLFDIVGHLNLATELITQAEEREALAELNLAAGEKARNATAYATARSFVQTGLELLRADCWQTQYELTLNLHVAAADTAHLNGDFEGMEVIATRVLQAAQNILDKVKIYQIQISALTSQSQMSEAIAMGENVLTQLGIEFSSEADEALTNKALQTVAQQLQDKQIEALIDLPVMSDQQTIAAMQLLAMLFAPIFLAKPALLPLHCSTMVSLSLQFGNAPASTIGYVGYGMVLSAFSGEAERGYRFGRVALNLLNQFNVQEYKSLTLLLFGAFLQHCREALRAEISLTAKEGYLSGMETGNFLYAGYNLSNYFHHNFFAGVCFDDWEPEIENYCTVLARVKQDSALIYLKIQQQMVNNLRESIDDPDCLKGDAYDETVMISKHYQDNEFTAIARVYIDKLMLAYLFGHYGNAIEYINPINSHVMAVVGTIHIPVFHFYAGLTYLSQLPTQSKIEQANTLALVETHQKTLVEWAHHAPMNHQHKYDLVEAEKCRVLAQKAEAIEVYDRAIARAKENEYIQDEALANELAAKFYLDWGKDKIAQTYMIEAYYCYARWGAKAKIVQLEKQYPALLSPIVQQQQKNCLDALPTVTNTNTQSYQTSNSTSTHLLDLTSVIKAYQVLSGEMELEKLMRKLMQVILENAGATKGVLMINRNGQLMIEAVAIQSLELDKNLTITQKTLPIEESAEVPLKLLNVVKRQLKLIVVDDFQGQFEWAGDQYMLTQQPKSLLCLPLLSQGQLLAILYLENCLMTQAFTAERVEVLKLLCSQAAISLENAELYRKSQDYAHQLEQSLIQLQEAQVQLVQSEKMSALGEMMSGITHEINNPLSFIAGNIHQVEETTQDLLSYLELYQQYHPPGVEVTAYGSEIELEYLLEDLPEMMTSMKTGVNRIQDISKSMRIFSRADQNQTVEFDLHQGLDSTLLILKHRLKAHEKRPEIQIIKDYGNLPKINGFPGQLNQVFMNILANAVDVFDEMSQKLSIAEIKQNSYQIRLKTELDSNNKTVNIHIQDNGCGMPESVKNKIFEHLYTTKAVGKGTGLGLSIARQIVVDKHQGKLDCYSTVGVGTEFVIKLPINPDA